MGFQGHKPELDVSESQYYKSLPPVRFVKPTDFAKQSHSSIPYFNRQHGVLWHL